LILTNLLRQAEQILERVRQKFGNKIHHAYGPPIDKEKATELFERWIRDNSVSKNSTCKSITGTGIPTLEFSDSILCSAKLVTHGPRRRSNKPENRNYKLVIRITDDQHDNLFLRERSFLSLLDHELGTHFFRLLNEGMQPWYFDRKQFGLCNPAERDMLEIEEGLAAIHTALHLPVSELWFPAILYVTGCFYEMNNYNSVLTTRQLQRYCDNSHFCDRLTKRAANKRASHDQAYLIGAVKILKQRADLDFHMLMSGKLLPSELKRTRRIVRQCSLKIPKFMNDMGLYMARLNEIAKANFID